MKGSGDFNATKNSKKYIKVCVYTDWFFSIIGIPEEAWGEALP
jgi:hypothetical protein